MGEIPIGSFRTRITGDETMRIVEIKSVETGRVVARYHWYNTSQAKEKALDTLPSGEYLIQGTNSMACKPRISRKAWQSAEKFEVTA